MKYTRVTITYLDNLPPSPSSFVLTSFQKDSILSRTENTSNQTISYQVNRKRNDGLGTINDSTITLTYPFNEDHVNYSFSADTSSTLDTIQLMGQPGNIPAIAFTMDGYDTTTVMIKGLVVFVKGLGGPYLTSAKFDGIGSQDVFGSLEYSKNGEPPVPIYFNVTGKKRKLDLLVVRPNPFADYIEIPVSTFGSRFYITDMQGKSLATGLIDSRQLDLRTLNTGIYQLAITLPSGEMKVLRIVKI